MFGRFLMVLPFLSIVAAPAFPQSDLRAKLGEARTLAGAWSTRDALEGLRYRTKACYLSILYELQTRGQNPQARIVSDRLTNAMTEPPPGTWNVPLSDPSSRHDPRPYLDQTDAPLAEFYSYLTSGQDSRKLRNDLSDLVKHLKAYRNDAGANFRQGLPWLTIKCVEIEESLGQKRIDVAQAKLAEIWSWILDVEGEQPVQTPEGSGDVKGTQALTGALQEARVSDPLRYRILQAKLQYFAIFESHRLESDSVRNKMDLARAALERAKMLGHVETIRSAEANIENMGRMMPLPVSQAKVKLLATGSRSFLVLRQWPIAPYSTARVREELGVVQQELARSLDSARSSIGDLRRGAEWVQRFQTIRDALEREDILNAEAGMKNAWRMIMAES